VREELPSASVALRGPYRFLAFSQQRYLADAAVHDSFLPGPDLKQGCFYQVSIRHLSRKVITTVRLVLLQPSGLPSGVHTRRALCMTSYWSAGRKYFCTVNT